MSAVRLDGVATERSAPPKNARGTLGQNRHGSASEIIQRHQWEAHAKGVHGCYQRTPEDGGKWHFRDFWRQLLLVFFHLFHSKTHWIRTQLDERSILMGHLLNFGEKKPGSCFSGTGPPVVEPAPLIPLSDLRPGVPIRIINLGPSA